MSNDRTGFRFWELHSKVGELVRGGLTGNPLISSGTNYSPSKKNNYSPSKVEGPPKPNYPPSTVEGLPIFLEAELEGVKVPKFEEDVKAVTYHEVQINQQLTTNN